ERGLRVADGARPPTGLVARVDQDAAEPVSRRCRNVWPVDGGLRWTASPRAPLQGRIRLYDPRREDDVQRFVAQELWTCAWRCDDATGPGEHDLGTLVLREPALLVAGEIDIGPQPWRGPPLFVKCEIAAKESSVNVVTNFEESLRCDRTLAVRGESEADRLRLSVWADRCFLAPPPVVVDRGARGVRIALDRGASLHARVLAPAAYARAVTCRV